MRAILLGCMITAGLFAGTAEAGDRRSGGWLQPGLGQGHAKSSYYRGGPQVRGYVARRGGYSYSYSDTINTHGDARSLFGGTNVYRDRMLGRQGGPFDHGFFFDSGVGLRGGYAPYMN
jgi:hypothetical protein